MDLFSKYYSDEEIEIYAINASLRRVCYLIKEKARPPHLY